MLKKVFISAISALALMSCAPGLGSSIDVAPISRVDFEPIKTFEGQNSIKLNVLNFADARSIEALAQIDGRLIKPSSDVTVAAQRIFEAKIKSAGVRLALYNAPSVRGTLKEWRVEVVPGFPSTRLRADSSILIELLDLDGRVIHRSEYSGHFEEEHPFMSESKVQRALSKVMIYAADEVLKDPRFVNKVATLAGTTEAIGSFPAGAVNELNY